MIPAQFDYVRPTTVDEALQALRDGGDDAKILAGGQSLLPVLRLRMADPSLIIDLNGIPELKGVREDGDRIVVGAMTSHYDVTRDDTLRQHVALIQEATKTVADPQVRHKGTLGGALAHADPAGHLAAAALALEAEFVIAGADGTRTVAAADFFEDYFTTAIGDAELLTEIRFPKYTGWGARYEKFNRVAQAWAIVGVAAAVRMEGGSVAEARIGLTNMGSTPVRATAVEEALRGPPAEAGAIAAAAAHAADGTTPPEDLGGKADYRRHLAQVLTRRALMTAARL